MLSVPLQHANWQNAKCKPLGASFACTSRPADKLPACRIIKPCRIPRKKFLLPYPQQASVLQRRWHSEKSSYRIETTVHRWTPTACVHHPNAAYIMVSNVKRQGQQNARDSLRGCHIKTSLPVLHPVCNYANERQINADHRRILC